MFAKIAGISAARPPHRISALETVDLLRAIAGHGAARRVPAIVEASRIGGRSIAASVATLRGLSSIRERVDLHDRAAVDLATAAARGAVECSQIDPRSIRLVVTASTTGFATPQLAARVIDRLGLTNAISRIPIGPQGCIGGLAALRVASALVRAGDAESALVVGVEVPSAWLPTLEPSPADLLAIAQLGDGAGAVVLSRSLGKGSIVIRAADSALLDRTFVGGGFVLTATGPRFLPSRGLEGVLSSYLAPAVEGFLRRAGLNREDVGSWLIHPRNIAMLDAIRDALNLDDRQIEPSHALLADAGNTIGASVFLLLSREIERTRKALCRPIVLLAVGGAGGGAVCELALLGPQVGGVS